MLGWLFGNKSHKRSLRQTPGADRAERNAVIKRVVAAAAKRGQKNAEEAAANAPVVESHALVAVGSADSAGVSVSTTSVSQDRVADRAYEIWTRNGRPTGTHDRDWQQAIRELEAEQTPAPRTTVAR